MKSYLVTTATVVRRKMVKEKTVIFADFENAYRYFSKICMALAYPIDNEGSECNLVAGNINNRYQVDLTILPY
jgi:hypothetical protein